MSYKIATQRAEINRNELVDLMARAITEDGALEPFPGFFLYRVSKPTEHVHGVYSAAFCVIAQGTKQVILGDEAFHYDPAHYLLSTVELPTVSQVIEASEERPYLSFRLELDPAVVSSVMMEAKFSLPRAETNVKALNVSPLDSNLLDAAFRLVQLLDTPQEIPVLAPLITREIIYRLLLSDQGARLSHLAAIGGHSRRIAKAVERLHEDYDQHISVENMARDLGMSISGFHSHFKSVTAMSPLQFQKQLRLQEARRLMLGEDLDAASAGLHVGYENPSQFSREYKKLFGAPPQRDIAKLRSRLEV